MSVRIFGIDNSRITMRTTLFRSGMGIKFRSVEMSDEHICSEDLLGDPSEDENIFYFYRGLE